MNNILKEIRSAEKKANDIIKKAQKNKDITIKNFYNKLLNNEKEKIDKYKIKIQKKNKKEKEKIQKDVEEIILSVNEKSSLILKKSKSNTKKAMDFLLDKFSKSLR